MRDHTPDFKMQELSAENKSLIKETVQQLLVRLAGDSQLSSDSLLEFWVEVPGVKRPRGTYRGGFLMPDSFVYITDYVQADGDRLVPAPGYREMDKAWDDLLDELYYQVEIFTSQADDSRGIMLELWTGHRNRPEGEWIYAVDRKIELV
ncbi:hypothetical protein INT08_03045 [Prosthecochloris sp. N3]|uniref:Uncharacterized protein n=1 Tax=Prosthecochloris ethylica TaxID=2743976 RepID=A0ABR9XQQ7_9CHLB|nr:hypothetical protein [Prosthecochloris ethylica]MBF0586547.1 hypothetical protein [Prosthecochloris ethylica]MBF0636160.1 hypothetical protein [Prosthecochloris ethylica]NUK47703.1 hypothetical protein [Prosthecochloris ethylica]